jgi:cold shock CspA family protein
MVENYKFCLKEYKKKYKREAEIGDLVIYTMKNETIEFKDKKENIKTILFKQREKVAAINTIRHGVVTTVSEHFGFIESNGEPIYFSLSKFKKLFNREPKKGEHLSFEATKSEKGTQVNSFVKISQEMSVTENTFQNFVQIDPTSLYYVYTQNGYAKEVYKYNPEDLSQSITCYNDRSIEKKFKIMSIDCLLEHNYSNKKISIQILKEEKNEIINGFVVRSIEDNDFEKALKYETLLQTIVYSPSRLKRIAKISQIPAYVLQEDTTSPIIIEQIKNSERLEVITGDKKIQLLGNKECYFVDLHEHHPVQNISPNDNWDIKLEIPPQVNNLFAHGERWKIKIKD